MTSLPPGWSLIREIVRVVNSAPCGGIHRAELAEWFCLPPHSQSMRDALGTAYRHRKIDFCRQYVVRPPGKP
jgi:hypothetical protein